MKHPLPDSQSANVKSTRTTTTANQKKEEFEQKKKTSEEFDDLRSIHIDECLCVFAAVKFFQQ